MIIELSTLQPIPLAPKSDSPADVIVSDLTLVLLPVRKSGSSNLSSWMNSVSCPLAPFGRGQAVFSFFIVSFRSSLHLIQISKYPFLFIIHHFHDLYCQLCLLLPHGRTLCPAPWPHLAEGRQEISLPIYCSPLS